MKTIVVVIRDSAANAYGIPQFCAARGTALRGFVDEVNRPDSPLAKHPDDYELFLLGEYDDSVPCFSLLEVPELILRGKDAVRPVSG